MLSILIPSYNYNAVSLVKDLYNQCNYCDINYEILVYDDGSKSHHNLKNTTINNLNNCSFEELPSNIGRSQIRNKLAKDAKFKHLLFLDCDVLPEHKHFIKNYLQYLTFDVVYGGLSNDAKPPKKPYKLRWLYTKEREQKSMCSSNFFIKKKIMLNNLFDESILKYGYEDVIFFKSLENNKITITPIKNSVIHFGNEKSKVYIGKIETSLENLSYLFEKNKMTAKESKIYFYYTILSKFHLVNVMSFCFEATKKLMHKNFDSSFPSLFLFDFYRLGFFCTIKSKK
jgi:hypothetical protein